MKIVLAADGSAYTKKALAFLVTHDSLAGADDEVIIVNVQPELPPRVRAAVGASVVKSYHADESEKVLRPIRKFMEKHDIRFRCEAAVGMPADVILRTAKKSKSHLIVMGTHGHGVLGRALLGSVAQKVVTGAEVPVMLVK